MLTPIKLSTIFRQFCEGKVCSECHISKLCAACQKHYSGTPLKCSVVWFVYKFLADRGLLHKNPNDLRELLVEEDIQKLVAHIAQEWDIDRMLASIPEPHDPPVVHRDSSIVHPLQCDFCPQRIKCDRSWTSCRLYFALENYKYIFDRIQHASTLRETR